jgi:hypothetical protein
MFGIGLFLTKTVQVYENRQQKMEGAMIKEKGKKIHGWT